jgi:hypothetical protein
LEEPAPLLSRLCFGVAALFRRGSVLLSLGFPISIFAEWRAILALAGMTE